MSDQLTHDAQWAADQLGIAKETVLRRARNREIPHVRIGRYVRFTEKNIADYIAANTVGSAMVRSRRSSAYHSTK